MIITYEEQLQPIKGTPQSTCYDLRASEETTILPGEVKLIPTGIKTNFANKIYARSSLAYKRKLMLANSVGIIDADYRDEIKVMVYNFGTDIQVIDKYERIAQIEIDGEQEIIIDKQIYNIWKDYIPTERLGGFGSTGKI